MAVHAARAAHTAHTCMHALGKNIGQEQIQHAADTIGKFPAQFEILWHETMMESIRLGAGACVARDLRFEALWEALLESFCRESHERLVHDTHLPRRAAITNHHDA